MHIKKIAAIALSAIMGLFIVQNMAFVEIDFFFWSFSLPRSLLLLIGLATGGLIGWLWHSYLVHGKKEG